MTKEINWDRTFKLITFLEKPRDFNITIAILKIIIKNGIEIENIENFVKTQTKLTNLILQLLNSLNENKTNERTK